MKKLLIIIGVTVGLNTALADWPRKMWEIDLGQKIPPPKNGTRLAFVSAVSEDKSVLLRVNDDVFWISSDGFYYKIANPKIFYDPNPGTISNAYYFNRNMVHLSKRQLVYLDSAESAIRLQRKNGGVVQSTFKFPSKFRFASGDDLIDKEWDNNSLVITESGQKLICWDLTPPPSEDDGNNGGNETANSRVIIKTAGPDIALATDGKLGAAELQKSNDLRSWRKLVDVPKEAAEILVTPRESGSEFYRLKKK